MIINVIKVSPKTRNYKNCIDNDEFRKKIRNSSSVKVEKKLRENDRWINWFSCDLKFYKCLTIHVSHKKNAIGFLYKVHSSHLVSAY